MEKTSMDNRLCIRCNTVVHNDSMYCKQCNELNKTAEKKQHSLREAVTEDLLFNKVFV